MEVIVVLEDYSWSKIGEHSEHKLGLEHLEQEYTRQEHMEQDHLQVEHLEGEETLLEGSTII